MLFTLNLICLTFPWELKVITQALQSYAIYPFWRGINKNLVVGPIPTVHTKLEFIIVFHNIQTFLNEKFLFSMHFLANHIVWSWKVSEHCRPFPSVRMSWAGKELGTVPARRERADTRVTLCSHSQHTLTPVRGVPEVSHGWERNQVWRL